MRAYHLPFFLLLLALALRAQTSTPPGQPTSGPGGSTYIYSSVESFGPFYSTPGSSEPYTEFYIFEPSGGPAADTFPVVLLLHAYLLKLEGNPIGDDPDNYTYWINHLVQNGYTVVFPTYDATLQPPQFTSNIITSWQAALSLLQSGSVSGLVAPSSDSNGLLTVFAGHSLGAYESFAVASQLTTNPTAGVPVPRAIAAFQPGVGMTGELPIAFSQIDPGVRVVLVNGDDDISDVPTAQAIWNSISTSVTSGNRDILEVMSDSHGSPAQLGNHWYPNTNGFLDDDSGVDDRDFNITWKLSVGLFNCVLAGTDCSYGLGHGSTDQIDMGSWSDGTPVIPLSLQSGGLPIVSPGGVISASSFGAFTDIAPGTFIEIYGSNLADDARGWGTADFNGNNAPTALDGTKVTIGGQPAFVSYISTWQLDVLVPSNVPSGTQPLTVTTGGGTSSTYMVTVNSVEPGLLAPSNFNVNGTQYVAALFTNGSYALPSNAISGISSNPAAPGDVIILYGIGFGPTATPAGQLAESASTLPAGSVQFTIGGSAATVQYAGLAPGFTGLYQFNITVPNVSSGNSVPLTFSVNGTAGTQTLSIAMQE